MSQETLSKSVSVAEVFSSLQGEGPRMGERHLFIRFPVCNLHCEYCDETGLPEIEMDADTLIGRVRSLERECGPHAFISLTGGEPLLYVPAIRQIGPVLKREGFRFFLETSGVLTKALIRVLDLMDVISMDIKLPSVTKDRSFFKEHREFLEVSQAKEVYVKIVVSKEVCRDEFEEAVRLIRDVNPRTLLVLQPVTAGDEKEIDRHLLDILSELQSVALRSLENVRILPRLHKVLGVK